MNLPTIIICGLAVCLISCTVSSSESTGWEYNNPKNGGFQKVPYLEQETGPGLVLIEGGLFNIALDEPKGQKKQVQIPSFYMDKNEVKNFDWLEYMYWTNRVYGNDFPQIGYNTLPDTNCWMEHTGQDAMVVDYLRHPSYKDYPVVGVSWLQANDYCHWRTDRVNEYILIREGVLVHNPQQQNEPFVTDSYLVGQYENGLNYSGQIPDLDPSNAGGGRKELGTRRVRMADGILLPRYRLPTEAEWEYAASHGIDFTDKMHKKHLRKDVANDFLSVTKQNFEAKSERFFPNGTITVPVKSYFPNDLGIYHLNDNVSEWVADVYQPRTESNIKSIAPQIGSSVKATTYATPNYPAEKMDECAYDIPKMIEYMDALERNMNQDEKSIPWVQKMIDDINGQLAFARKEDDKLNHAMAASYVRTIFDVVFDDYLAQASKESFESPRVDVIRQITVGLSKFVTMVPGRLQMRDVSPADLMVRRNTNNGYFWESNFDSTSFAIAIGNEERVYKGASFLNQNAGYSDRQQMNKYEASCLVGFRCVMDRFGSPKGLKSKD